MKYKIIGIVALFIGLVFIYFAFNPSSSTLFPKCILYVGTGIYCPGCGSQRATHALLHGDIYGAMSQNLLFLVGLLILGYHFIISFWNKLFKQRVYNYLHHPKVPLFLLVFIVLFWILRNIDKVPFSWLAPN
jgi:hypothetical protein